MGATAAGPNVHVIDALGLADAVGSRIPAGPARRIGHQIRSARRPPSSGSTSPKLLVKDVRTLRSSTPTCCSDPFQVDRVRRGGWVSILDSGGVVARVEVWSVELAAPVPPGR